MTDSVRQFTVGYDDDGIRLDRWFKRHMPDTSFTTVAKWARTGQLRVDGLRAAPGDRIAAGQVLRVPPAEPALAESSKPTMRPRHILSEDEESFAREMVIHKDRDALVLNKPPGLATQGGTKTTQHVDGLLDALQFEAEGGPLVHRLDKDTSGALLVARNARAAAFFAKAFSGRTAKKIYWALVVGVPSIDDGTIELPIAKQPGTGGEKMHVDEENGQSARSRYRVIERAGNSCCWVELQPFTGAPISCACTWPRSATRSSATASTAGGGVPDRRDQPQDAPARAPHPRRSSRWRPHRPDGRAADPLRRIDEPARLRRDSRRRPAPGRRSRPAAERSPEAARQGARQTISQGTPRRTAG